MYVTLRQFNDAPEMTFIVKLRSVFKSMDPPFCVNISKKCTGGTAQLEIAAEITALQG